nr:reverse transcriptase domain-containing protein [Tanacetum cinerariifolium]
MDKVRRERRKDVHTRLDFEEGPRERTREDSHHSSARARTTKPKGLRVQDHLRYGDRLVLDRLGHRRQSAFDRVSETYSLSTTKSRPCGTNSRDHPLGRSRPHRLDTSNDCPKDMECFRSVGESYDNSFSHSYRDGNRSRHMKRRRDNESPLSSVSKSDSSDGRTSPKGKLQTSWKAQDHSRDSRGSNRFTPLDLWIHAWEAAAASKKKGHASWKAQDHSRDSRGSNRFTPLTRTPKEILAAEAGKFQPPPPMVTPVEKRSSNKFCDFHNDKWHSTDESSSGTEGPLVIEAEMGGHMIHRMHVDGGSSMEIL